MASITKYMTKAGIIHYYGDIVVNGKRFRKYLGLSKRTAKLALQELEYELRYGKKDGRSENVTYKEAILKFKAHVALTGTSVAQIKYIESRINAFRKYCSKVRHNKLEEITPDDCRQYITRRSHEHITNFYKLGSEKGWKHPAKSTLNREIGFQKRFFQFCVDNDYLENNVWSRIPKFRDKSAQKPRYAFSDHELKMILDASGKFHDFFLTLLLTGLRPTDTFALQATSFSGNMLSIPQRKTGEWIYNIPIPTELMNTLSKRIESGGAIFSELQSDRQRRKARLLVQGLFPSNFVRDNNINLHTFRHTYARIKLKEGMPKEVLQSFLGHKSIRTTEIYANWVSTSELSKWVE